MEGKTDKRLSIKRPILVAGVGVGLCILTWAGAGIHLYWNDPKLVNFMAAWIPTVGSVVVAFVPEARMTLAKKWRWRSSVIAIGFAWSVILWHQQVVTEATNTSDQQRIVGQAVTESNAHSDDRIGKVGNDVQALQGKVAATASKQDLDKTGETITKSFAESQTQLAAKIDKIKSEPDELVKLQFSIFSENSNNAPLLTQASTRNSDGTYSVDVSFKNAASHQAAEDADVWLLLCDACTFVSDPAGWDRPSGLKVNMLHKMVHILNPGTWIEKTTLRLKIAMSAPFTFEVGLKYSCKLCDAEGIKTPQTVHFVVLS